jgi:hypothetical protein
MEPLEQFVKHLRDERRIKRDVDYAMMVKRGEIHILCDKSWMDDILEAADKFGLWRIMTVQTADEVTIQ